MAIYNVSFMDNSTNILDVFIGVGDSVAQRGYGSQYLIGYLILLSFFMIFLTLSFKYDYLEVLLVDSFLTIFLAVLLYASKGFLGYSLIPSYIISYPVVLFIIVIFIYMIRGKT